MVIRNNCEIEVIMFIERNKCCFECWCYERYFTWNNKYFSHSKLIIQNNRNYS